MITLHGRIRAFALSQYLRIYFVPHRKLILRRLQRPVGIAIPSIFVGIMTVIRNTPCGPTLGFFNVIARGTFNNHCAWKRSLSFSCRGKVFKEKKRQFDVSLLFCNFQTYNILSYSSGFILCHCTYGCLYCMILFKFVNYVFLLCLCILIVMYSW